MNLAARAVRGASWHEEPRPRLSGNLRDLRQLTSGGSSRVRNALAPMRPRARVRGCPARHRSVFRILPLTGGTDVASGWRFAFYRRSRGGDGGAIVRGSSQVVRRRGRARARRGGLHGRLGRRWLVERFHGARLALARDQPVSHRLTRAVADRARGRDDDASLRRRGRPLRGGSPGHGRHAALLVGAERGHAPRRTRPLDDRRDRRDRDGRRRGGGPLRHRHRLGRSDGERDSLDRRHTRRSHGTRDVDGPRDAPASRGARDSRVGGGREPDLQLRRLLADVSARALDRALRPGRADLHHGHGDSPATARLHVRGDRGLHDLHLRRLGRRRDVRRRLQLRPRGAGPHAARELASGARLARRSRDRNRYLPLRWLVPRPHVHVQRDLADDDLEVLDDREHLDAFSPSPCPIRSSGLSPRR